MPAEPPIGAENAGRAFALVFVDELARRGVRHAVLAPGSRSTPLALALLEDSRIAVHVRIDERSAAYLALGIAKASGRVVPVLCTSGTATSYLHGAVMEADLARVPLLALTADRPAELHGIGANQTVEQSGLYGGAVRWAGDVDAPAPGPDRVREWRSLVATAVERCLGAGGHPAGPVQLNLALREPLIPVDDGVGFGFELGLGAPAESEPVADQGAELPERLGGAFTGVRSGVVIAGGCGAPIGAAVKEFAERVNWPLIAEPHSGARGGSMALRATDGVLRDQRFTEGHRPDLVLVVGRVGLSRPLLEWLAGVPHVVLSPDGGPWDVTRAAQAVVYAPADVLAKVDVPPAPAEWALAWHSAAGSVAAAVDAALDETDRLSEPRVARDVAHLVPDGTALVVSSSMPIRDLDVVMHPRETIQVLANRGVSGIDGFVSTAQGIAIARAGGPTVALCGDLSLLHDSNGLLPGPDRRPDVTYIVINNDGGGIFSLLPQRSAVAPADFERLFGTPHGLSLERFAAAYDVEHRLVTHAAGLADLLSNPSGLRIVEIRTDRGENAALHARLRAINPHL